MICSNCGAENADDSKFCMKCGQSLKSVAAPETNNDNVTQDVVTDTQQFTPNAEAQQPVQPEQFTPNYSMPQQGMPQQGMPQQGMPNGAFQFQPMMQPVKPKKSHKKLIIILAAILAVLVTAGLIVFFVVTAKPTVDLNKYLKIEFSGYDGYGKANASIDWEAIEAKYGKKIKFTSEAKKELGVLIKLTSPLDALSKAVSVDIDSGSKLKNGDEIAYTWNLESDISKYIKVKLKSKNGTYTVNGLTEISTFDAFEDLEITFFGTAPSGYMSLIYNGDMLDSSDFNYDKSNGLSNGDVITVTIDESEIEHCAEKYGKVPSSSKKEYIVEGLLEYVQAFSDMPTDYVNTLKSETETIINNYVTSSYSETSSLSDLQYAGYILNTTNADSFYDYNYLYIIFKGTVSTSTGDFPDTTVYFPVCFSGVMKNGEEFSYENKSGIQGYSLLNGYWTTTYGYSNPYLCYKECAVDYETYCDVALGDGIEVFTTVNKVEYLGDLDENIRTKMAADAKSTVDDFIAQNFTGNFKVSDVTQYAECILVSKEQDIVSAWDNKYYIIYTATLKYKSTKTTLYFPVEYDEIIKLPDNTYIVTFEEGIQGYCEVPDSWYYMFGYTDEALMFEELITDYCDEYNYEVTENLVKFVDTADTENTAEN